MLGLRLELMLGLGLGSWVGIGSQVTCAVGYSSIVSQTILNIIIHISTRQFHFEYSPTMYMNHTGTMRDG